MAKTTIEFGEESTEELNRLAQTLETTKAEVLRNALSLYGYLFLQLKQPGRELAIITENGQRTIEKVIVVPGIRKTMYGR